MAIYEVFIVLTNGVTARGCVPGTSYANARTYVLANLNVTPAQVASMEVTRVH